jgi:hypothetical protein
MLAGWKEESLLESGEEVDDTWNLDADCGERWSTEACVRARAFLGGRGGGEISSCDRAWLELGDTTTPKDERD